MFQFALLCVCLTNTMPLPVDVTDVIDGVFGFIERNGFFLLLLGCILNYVGYYYINPWLGNLYKKRQLSLAKDPDRVTALDGRREQARQKLLERYEQEKKVGRLVRQRKEQDREEKRKLAAVTSGYNPLTGTGSSRGGSSFQSSRRRPKGGG